MSHDIPFEQQLGPPEPDTRGPLVGLPIEDHRGYHMLGAVASHWPVTAATPAGPADMLKLSRDAFALAFYSYELLAIAGTWSIFATEAALRARYEADETVSLKTLVNRAEADRILPSTGWEDERLDTGRKLRNKAVHEGTLARLTPGMAELVIEASHELVAALLPDKS